MKNQKGRIIMMAFYLVVTVAYVVFRGQLQASAVEEAAMTLRVASVCFKLVTACLLVYMLMLILNQSEDKTWEKKTGRKMQKPADHHEESLPLNIGCAIVIVAIYVVLTILKLV